jgi:hypothetical protein
MNTKRIKEIEKEIAQLEAQRAQEGNSAQSLKIVLNVMLPSESSDHNTPASTILYS